MEAISLMNCPSITLMYSPTCPWQLDLRRGRRDRSAEGVEKGRERHTSPLFHSGLHTSTQPRYWEETWLARLVFGLSKGRPRPRITGGNLTVLPESDGGGLHATCYDKNYLLKSPQFALLVNLPVTPCACVEQYPWEWAFEITYEV